MGDREARDGTGGELAALAADLRALRKAAGYPTFGELAAGTPVTARELAEAARGQRCPQWEAVAVYVAACGGEPAAWRARYDAVRARPARIRVRQLPVGSWRSLRPAGVRRSPASLLLTTLALGVAVLGIATALHRGGASGAAGGSGGDGSGPGAVAAQRPEDTAPGSGHGGGDSGPDGGFDDVPPTSTHPGLWLPASSLIKRADSPEISVYTGSARIAYRTWDDLVAGYGSEPTILIVSDSYYDGLPTQPAAGTLVKEAGRPDIAVLAGSGRLSHPSWAELVARYGAEPQAVTVPTYFFDALAQQ